MPPKAINGTMLPICAICPRVAWRVPCRAATCADFVRHHAGHLGFVVGVQQNPGVDEEEPARQREGVDLFRIDHLDGERNFRIRVPHQILANPVHVFGDDRIVDNLGLTLHFLGHLLAQRDLFFDRVEVDALTDVAIADFVGIFFFVRRRTPETTIRAREGKQRKRRELPPGADCRRVSCGMLRTYDST